MSNYTKREAIVDGLLIVGSLALAACVALVCGGCMGDDAIPEQEDGKVSTTGETGDKGSASASASGSMSASSGSTSWDGSTTGDDTSAETTGGASSSCVKLLEVGLRPPGGSADRMIIVESTECDAWEWNVDVDLWTNGAIVDGWQIAGMPPGACVAIGEASYLSPAPAWIETTIAEDVADFADATIYLRQSDKIIDAAWLPDDIFTEQGDTPPTSLPTLPLRRDTTGKWHLTLGPSPTDCFPYNL